MLYKPEDLRKVQEIELDILQEIIRVCKENDITYFIYGGTTLGAVRHKGFIPWDDDIDLGMLRDDFNRFLEIAPSKLKKGYVLQHYLLDPVTPTYHAKVRKDGTLFVEAYCKNINMHKGIFVDIMPFDYIPDDKAEQEQFNKTIIKYRNLYTTKCTSFVMDYDISIIIPCYNSEAFLSDTIEMLEKSDIKKCEIILVDDGSTDSTLRIMQDFRQIYDNIVIVSGPNSGVSVARNNGLKAARGRYVYFLDSDDLIENDALAYYKNMINEHCDCEILSFGYKMIHINGKETIYKNSLQNNKIIDGNIAADLFYKGKLFLNVCSILIKRDFILDNDMLFKEGITIGEDYDFLREIVLKVNKVYCSDKICFIYKLRRGSATNGQGSYGLNNFKSLLLSFSSADTAKGFLSDATINYYRAARFSAHLRSYLRSTFSSEEVNSFFENNRHYLFEKMACGRTKVMIAIMFFKMIPLKLLFSIYNKR